MIATMEAVQLLESAQWEAARDAFEAALREEESPDAHDGLGLALWFLGQVEEGIAARERAFDGFLREGRCDHGARTAAWVSHQYLLVDRPSAARGWLARAERALEDRQCEGSGWVAVERARQGQSIDECATHARRALEIARENGAGDLEVFALSLLGQAEVRAGRVVEGMGLLEEAMAAACAGRVRNVHTLAEAYCNLIAACTGAGEWERAAEWCELVDEFAREHGTMPLFGACRTMHADVLVARGRWPEAEHALESALETHARYVPAMGVAALFTMAELRIRQGRPAEAEQLLTGREENPASLRALAHLRIADGRPEIAAALLERGLATVEGDAIGTTQLLAPLVDAHLACGDADAAAAAATRLAEVAGQSGIRLAEARSELASARVHLATGRAPEAAGPAQRALAHFGRLSMPVEAGEARLELARALVGEQPALAQEEARAAFEVFRKLGASRAMDAAAGVLRDLGEATGAGRRSQGELTERERQVLELLTRGMSNAQIAHALFISEKTAGHHVSHILAKLGVRNRAEAAAQAARGDLLGSR
jgi:ATP/maltotriose-dependent transcriptional regulator MalT